jgi:predicted RNase H-like HicB family nuclease
MGRDRQGDAADSGRDGEIRGRPAARAPIDQQDIILKLTITIFRDEDGVFIAECPAIPGCVSQGPTEADAERNLVEAIRECLAVRAEQGLPRTVKIRDLEVLF